jgi:hypothetical protein
MNTSSKTDIATGAQAAAGASRGVVTPTQLTLAAVALLALCWGFLPDFTVVMLSYIGLYAIVALGLVMLTGVGGGLMRDMMAGEEPYIFVKHIYACASLVGALGCVWIYREWGRLPAVFIGAFIVMAIRFLAAHYRWNLPHPKSLS